MHNIPSEYVNHYRCIYKYYLDLHEILLLLKENLRTSNWENITINLNKLEIIKHKYSLVGIEIINTNLENIEIDKKIDIIFKCDITKYFLARIEITYGNLGTFIIHNNSTHEYFGFKPLNTVIENIFSKYNLEL